MQLEPNPVVKFSEYSIVAAVGFSNELRSLGLDVYSLIADLEDLTVTFCKQTHGMRFSDVNFHELVHRCYHTLGYSVAELDIPNFQYDVLDRVMIHVIPNDYHLSLVVDLNRNLNRDHLLLLHSTTEFIPSTLH